MKKKPLFLSILISIAAAIAMMSLLPAASAATGYIRGDANGDGKVDIADATMIQMVIAQMTLDTDGAIAKRGDVDGNGLDVADVTKIQRYLVEAENVNHIGERVTEQQPTRDEYELPFVPC